MAHRKASGRGSLRDKREAAVTQSSRAPQILLQGPLSVGADGSVRFRTLS